MLPIVAAFNVAVVIEVSKRPVAPMTAAPTLPIVPAFRVPVTIDPTLVIPPELTAKLVNGPTLVIFGCAAVFNVPVSVAPVLPIVLAYKFVALIVATYSVVVTTSVFLNIVVPATSRLPPTYKLPVTPTPPATCSAPDDVLVLGKPELIIILPKDTDAFDAGGTVPVAAKVNCAPVLCVIVRAVGPELIVAPPISMVLPLRYKLRKRCVGLPKSYVTFAPGK